MYDEYLEHQYRPWPNPQAVTDRWATESAAYLKQSDFVRNLAYGSKPAERLDILKRADVSNAPVLVFIHGGYWQRLDKDHFAFSLKPYIDAGIVVANVNYTLCPESTLDELVDQVRAACAWVWNNVTDYGGDADRIHVTGHSAGGHLTAMMATTDWTKVDSSLPVDLIKTATPISGCFELEPIRQTSLNDAVRMDADIAERNSPALLAPVPHLPICVAVGGAETDEFHRQSKLLVSAWQSSAQSIEYIEIPGRDHFTIIEEMVNADDELTQALMAQVGVS